MKLEGVLEEGGSGGDSLLVSVSQFDCMWCEDDVEMRRWASIVLVGLIAMVASIKFPSFVVYLCLFQADSDIVLQRSHTVAMSIICSHA